MKELIEAQYYKYLNENNRIPSVLVINDADHEDMQNTYVREFVFNPQRFTKFMGMHIIASPIQPRNTCHVYTPL